MSLNEMARTMRATLILNKSQKSLRPFRLKLFFFLYAIPEVFFNFLFSLALHIRQEKGEIFQKGTPTGRKMFHLR